MSTYQKFMTWVYLALWVAIFYTAHNFELAIGKQQADVRAELDQMHAKKARRSR